MEKCRSSLASKHALLPLPYRVFGILGSGANYIIPAVFNISLLKRLGANRGILSEISLNKAIIVFGAVFMVMGTVVTLKEAGSHH